MTTRDEVTGNEYRLGGPRRPESPPPERTGGIRVQPPVTRIGAVCPNGRGLCLSGYRGG